MRILFLLLASIFLISCAKEQESKKPDFLFGNWQRVNEKPNKTTYEFWSKNLTGFGFTLQEKDTVFKEALSIIDIKDTLYLKVEGVNATPTLFRITQQTDTSFVAENPTHDFPTTIKYWLESKQLKAKVSNKNFGIDFVFNKIE